MDRSFIITGLAQDGAVVRPIAGVLFSNSAPDPQALSRLGFFDIQSVEEVRPLSKQPTEPTLYVYSRVQVPSSVEAIRLDWKNAEVSRAKVMGEPSFFVPPVAGPAADAHLYIPGAFVISANTKSGVRSTPVVAVLFVKPEPGAKCLVPDKKMLNRLGLVDLQTVERVATSARPAQSMLYLFERTPAACSVSVFAVGADGKKGDEEKRQGEPHSIIPPIAGSAADRFVNPRGALSASDLPNARLIRTGDAHSSARAQQRRRS